MRILMTTDTVGGVWTFTKQLAIELLDGGHEVVLVSFGRAPSPTQAHWCQTTVALHPSFRYIASDVPLEWMQNNETVYPSGAALLLSTADRFQPDVLLSSQFCFGKLPLPVPRVVVAHSDVLSWARACRTVPLPSSPWLTQYVRLVSEGLDNASAVVAPTHWMLTALSRSFTLPQHAIVILNGRSISTKADNSSRTLQTVTAGRIWDEAKNLNVLRRINPSVPVLVAGSSAMESARASFSDSRIRFLGELDEPELFALFGRSAAYVCTSVYEPFGLAPLEAALCGCAVIANDIPSLHEVWGDCAIFFRDETTLAAALDQLKDPGLLWAAQSRSRARAEMFTAGRMTERYLNLFDRLHHCTPLTRSSHAA